MAFISPIYEAPFGIELGGTSIDNFSGEPVTGLLVDASGAIFFSPALLDPKPGNEIVLNNIDVTAYASDVYEKPQGSLSKRVFTWGPNSNARTNQRAIPDDNKWVTAPKAYTVIATMIQTIPPGPTTIFKLP